MASGLGLADMPQEVLTMILRELFAGTVIKKIKFTKIRAKNSQRFSRSWLPIMLANQIISHVAKEVFSQEAIVGMKPKQLVSTKARGVGANLRCGEKELQYFEKAVGDFRFLSSLLYYTSADQKKSRGSGLRYTMFSNLKTVYLRHATVSMSDTYGFRTIRTLMSRFVERGVNFVAYLRVYSNQTGGSMWVLLKSSGQAELGSASFLSEEMAEKMCNTIQEQLNCRLSLTYRLSSPTVHDQNGEVLRRYSGVGQPGWV